MPPSSLPSRQETFLVFLSFFDHEEHSEENVTMTKRAINDFHLNHHVDWVAELECGHTQHVRHNPPWTYCP